MSVTLLQATTPLFATTSQLPGLFVTPPDVNVMFTLDDSGSMQSDALPDYPTSASGVPNDAASGFFASSGLGSKYPNMWGVTSSTNSGYLNANLYRSTNGVAVYMRSSSANPLYYDPDVTYLPWPNSANDTTTRNANASPTAVNIGYDSPFSANRTINLDVRWNTSGGSTAADDQTKNFWPATWYVWKYKSDPTKQLPLGAPATALTLTDFTKYEIKSTNTTATFPRAASRTDCTGTVGPAGCTYTQERQNFANWLQYYRNRRLMAKGGVAEAFSRQGTNLRVGFASINTTTNGTVVRLGVKPFTGAARKAFYDDLYPLGGSGLTPLRKAMDQVGQYFQKTGAGNPWAEDPTASGVGTEWTCRKSFHILSTDGYWNDAAATTAAKNDNDSFSGQTPKKPGAATGYDYSNTGSSSTDPLVGKYRIDPFADGATGIQNTLADVAAYYWKTDLRTDLANEVFTTSRDPAFWQHVTTFTVGLGLNGSGTVRRRSDNAVAVPATEPSTSPFYPYIGKNWLENQTMRDLVVANKVALKWWPDGTSSSGPAGDDISTADDLIHAAINGRGRYFSANNPRELATNLASALAEATNKSSSLSNLVTQTAYLQEGSFVYQATYNPDGWAGRLYAFKQNAKGGVVTTPGTEVWEASQQMPDPDNRYIFTWNDSTAKGALFTWSDLTTAQQGLLNNDSTILDYLRGSSAKELQNGGAFRDRPRYTTDTITKAGVLGDIVDGSPIKGPDSGGGWNRLPTMSPGQADYATFRSKDTTTLDNMRNSIFLTANDGMLHAFDATTGVERFAYVPASVYSVARSVGGATEQKLKMLSDPGYAHRFLVDGAPQIADAFVGPSAAAASWKTLLLGSTGAGSRSVFAMDVTDTDAKGGKFDKTKLMWEFPTASTPDMGYVLSYPHVARMRDKSWVAIFGNGYDSQTGQAKLYILDLQTGKVLKEIAAGAAGGNGLSQPNFTVNNSREVTAIYAGDLKGNLWRFDVDSEDQATWGVAFGGTPLFTAGNKQPITVMPELTFHPSGGVVVTFGTGKMFETEDTSTSTSTNVNLNTQSIYGIWDKPGATTGLTDASLLVEHKDDTTLAAAADTSLKGTQTNTVDASKRGWFINLVGSGERVTVNPQQAGTVLFVVANTPKVDPCSGGGVSRIFALDPVTGNPPTFGVFDADNSGTITQSDKGYNVWNISGGVLSLPLLQRKTGTGGVVTESKYSRGQTGARLGGVEPKPGNPTDCDANLLVGVSDTSGKNRDVSLCKKGVDRVSWRQLH